MASTDGARRAAADIVKGEAVMIEIDYKNRDPIYLQIVQSILKNIMLGNLREGDQLPTMRQLAIDLGINPNTVQKAYRELERDEVTYTIPGKGSFVGPSKKIDMELRRQFRGRFVELVREVKNFGVTLEEIESTINELLTEEKERGRRNEQANH
ncbi:MAG: GntR family transcriptional regulator [Fastidiosipilaceae bacterium]|jgi:GntR family transcriptional regulator